MPKSLLTVLLFSSLLLTACRGKPSFDSPYPEPGPNAPPRVSSLEEMGLLLAGRVEEHALFKAHGDVTISAAGERRKTRFTTTIIHRAPDALRVRGVHMLAGLLFELIVNGDKAQVYIRDGKELYTGTTAELQRQGGLIGAVPPRDLIGALLANNVLRRDLAAGGSWKVLVEKEYLFLIQRFSGGGSRLWRIRRSDGLIRDMVLRDPEGRPALHTTYRSWILTENGEPLPDDLTITIGDGLLDVRLEMSKYDPDPPLDPSVVTIEPSRVQARLPLSALLQREAVLPEE